MAPQTEASEHHESWNNFTSVAIHTQSPMRFGEHMHQDGAGESLLLSEKMSKTCLVALQMMANLSTCMQVNSEALVDCLRGKNEEEILAINKVRLNGVGVEEEGYK
jgi:hypothetical protein